VQYVERVEDEDAARAMGLERDQVVVLVHCGSRGLGHQVCTDFLAQMGAAMKKYGIELPDRQLACVPIQSEEGQSYLAANARGCQFCLGEPAGHFALSTRRVPPDFRPADAPGFGL
jgi:tRNA-splicing ligase RtcB (3'-phosphate/5'-hydroxy nucleic acid ligase)